MPIYSKSNVPQLRRRLEAVWEEIEKTAPTLAVEYRLIERLIAAAEAEPNQVYASARSPQEVITLCLDIVGDWVLTKREIADRIIEGGYLADKPKAARGLVNDALNYRLDKGYLILDEDLVGRSDKPKRRRNS